jgi:pyridinium-3,5-bisthiocarboxylic acid mononucleotide nickel chelatase
VSEDLRGCDLYFDCFSGIAGDMTLGALLDLGVPEEFVRGELAKLPVGGYRLERERVQRGALVGTKIHVRLDGEPHSHEHEQAHSHDHDHDHEHEHAHSHDHDHHDHDREHHGHHHHEHEKHDPRHAHHAHRHYRDIKKMLEQHLDGDVRRRALQIFDRIAVVEARLHGVTVEDVAFHEVGAIDSIVDIVGAAAGLAWLAPARITSRRVPLGGGTVDTAHGRLPVPAPATLELLAGADVEAGGDSELTTPTGAGILAASVSGYGAMPAMRVVGVGWGAGDRQLADRPNLLRVVAGRASAAEPIDCVVIEANVDDMNPEWCEPLTEALFAAGALDVWLTPIIMKKGRPALTVAALAAAAARDQVAAAMLRESTTIGVRFSTVTRTVLPRRKVEVDTPWGAVTVKLAGEGDTLNAAPEYADCRRVADAAGVPIKQVYAAALAAFFKR